MTAENKTATKDRGPMITSLLLAAQTVTSPEIKCPKRQAVIPRPNHSSPRRANTLEPVR